jgi:O-antigen/teichoic acid export membrane protein
MAIPLTVWFVVVEDYGADGLLGAIYLATVPMVAWLVITQRHRLALIPDWALLGRMVRFGLPTMPAELSLYSLNFIDRIIIVRLAGLAEAGLYALAIKFAQGINVLVRGFQLAWPPLAYSIRDDDEARHAYALIVTWFMAVCTFAVVGLWLLARWIVRLLAAPEFFDAYEAIGLLAAGITLYALYLVQVVVLGRTGRTEFNFPATIAATAANIGLNLALVPSLGIVGAGLALVASYLVVLALMYAFTQRLFPVPYEWGRLALVVGVAAALVGAGELLLPTEGAVGLLSRAALWLSYPFVLWAARFLTPEERRSLSRMLRPSAVAASLRSLRAAGPPEPAVASEEAGGRGPRLTEEVYEVERRDEDRGGA